MVIELDPYLSAVHWASLVVYHQPILALRIELPVFSVILHPIGIMKIESEVLPTLCRGSHERALRRKEALSAWFTPGTSSFVTLFLFFLPPTRSGCDFTHWVLLPLLSHSALSGLN